MRATGMFELGFEWIDFYREKLVKTVIYDKGRIHGGANYDSPGPRWVPKLVYYLPWITILRRVYLSTIPIRIPNYRADQTKKILFKNLKFCRSKVLEISLFFDLEIALIFNVDFAHIQVW